MSRRNLILVLLLSTGIWVVAFWGQAHEPERPATTAHAAAETAREPAPAQAQPAVASAPAAPPTTAHPQTPAPPQPPAQDPQAPAPRVVQSERAVAAKATTIARAETAELARATEEAMARREQNDDRYAFADARWEQERPDPDWAPAREAEFRRALQDDGFPETPYGVECRRTMCRIEAPVRDHAAFALKAARAFMGQIGPSAANGSVGEGLERVLVFYVPRDERTWQ